MRTLADLGLSDLENLLTQAEEDPSQAAPALTQLRRALLMLAVENDQLRRKMFGPKSEKITRAELKRQLALFEDVLEPDDADGIDDPLPPHVAAELAAMAAEAAKNGEAKGKPKRTELPKDLPRETVTHLVPPDECSCPRCGSEAMKDFGTEESTEQLEWVPGRFKRLRHRRQKLSCAKCSAVVTAPPPAQPIPKGIAGPFLLAKILVDKFVHHLPLYRQAMSFQIEHDVRIPRSTLCGWVRQAAERLAPICTVMIADVLKSKVIHTDDTSVRVQHRHSESETGKVRLWPYLGDAEHSHLVFDYTTSRKRDGPARFLARFAGYLQADAYAGYDQIYADGSVKEVGCWAHARRKFIECKDQDPRRVVAILALIQDLFDVERRGKRLSAEARVALRRRESRRLLTKLAAMLARCEHEVLPKGPLGKAIRYVQNQWDALTRYLEDGDLAIDNNAAERAIRPIAVGRKNWLFVGSDRAGDAMAVIYSLVGSCLHLGIDPQAYLRDVLLRVGDQPAERMWELTPLAWQAEQEQAAEAA